MSPFLERYKWSIGHAPPPPLRLAVVLPPARRFEPLHKRQCFICGDWGACQHREPELLVLAREGSDGNA